MYECGQAAIAYNNLNLPTYDTHANQSRDQILYNLETLKNSFQNMTSKLVNKSKTQNQRIEAIRLRILACKQRIASMSNANQALIFYSPAEYPLKYKFDPMKNVSIFAEYFQPMKLNRFDMKAHYQMKHEIHRLGNQSKFKIQQLNNFIAFLYGQLRNKKKTLFERGVAQKKNFFSLGRVPDSFKFLDSLSVFNSHVNPYRKYQLIDNSLRAREKKKAEQPNQTEVIQIDTPINQFEKKTFQKDTKKYIPTEKPIHQIIFDDSIGMQGIVDIDVSFQTTHYNPSKPGLLQKNVPSEPLQKKSSEAPTQKSNISQQTSSSINQPTQNSSISEKQTSQVSQSVNLPPPPPPPPKLSNNLLTLPPPPPGNLLPPPPPPPGNLLPPPPPGNLIPPSPPPLGNLLPPSPLSNNLPPPPSLSLMNKPVMSVPVSSGVPDRDALLKQIQNPNPMARLKKVKTKQTPNIMTDKYLQQKAKDNDAKPDSAKPMDFMSALRAKVNSRYRALHPQRQQQ